METQPKTPILEARLSKALEPLEKSIFGAVKFSQKYKRSVINWVCLLKVFNFVLVCSIECCRFFAYAFGLYELAL